MIFFRLSWCLFRNKGEGSIRHEIGPAHRVHRTEPNIILVDHVIQAHENKTKPLPNDQKIEIPRNNLVITVCRWSVVAFSPSCIGE